MAPPSKLTVALSAVTPLFLGGADPNEYAELRPPSFKGLLRYWYRALDGEYAALDGEYATREARLFGSTEAGQSPCLLRVSEWQVGRIRWDRNRYTQPVNRGGFQRGGRPPENGIVYLGYSLVLGDNDRRAIPTSPSAFTLEVQPRPGCDTPEVRRAWLASLWLLVHVGGVGSRSRRGLGSLRIEGWEGWPDCGDLPLPSQAATPEDWQSQIGSGLLTLRRWFPTLPGNDHTIVAPGVRLLVLRQGFDSWERALDDAGLRLQRFRRGVKVAERVGFGLPLTVVSQERMASPLFMRVLRLGHSYHLAFLFLPAPLPDLDGVRWPDNTRQVVQDFLDEQQPDAVEVRL
ncbi:MAG: type III-B CRISPR module RAMP protein Cmr1 [Chloroflexi bacterium]|nr:type III-B CRISPR module RAMP protein Cmr1 [Chloroflexota bacterium]